MNATRWQRIQELVEQASHLSPEERDRLVAGNTIGDPELRSQIEGMLRSFNNTGSFLEDGIGMAAARVTAGDDLEPGDRIGVYSITATLGHGGMGTVYLAQRSDDQFRQSVAIKLVRAGFGDTRDLIARFRAERQILANINHPNIARLLDGGITESGLPYLVMEFVEGLTLDRWILDTAPALPVRLELFRKLCSAIQTAHQNLVVHRDLKPGNILVTADGTPKLLDFGIAKLLEIDAVSTDTILYTRPADRLMTPEYASPEQIRGDVITTASDVYGLGVLLYEILTGTRPFLINKLSPADVERLICGTQPRPPSSFDPRSATSLRTQAKRRKPPRLRKQTDLDRIVLKAMHKLPARRYASAADLSTDVQHYLDGFPVAARPDSFRYRSSRFIARNRFAVAAATLFFLVIAGLSITSLVQARRARREAASADAVSNYLTGLFQFTRPDATQGRSVSARDILDSGTKQLNTDWHGEPAIKARLLSTLGIVYYQLGDLDRASSLLYQAQSIDRSLADTTSPEAIQTATVLGDLLIDKGNYAEAEQQYTRALDIQTRLHGRDSLEAANLMDGLARLLWTVGSFTRAEDLQRQVIAIASRKLGSEDNLVLTYRNNLEATLADAGNYRAAEPIARDLLDIRKRTLGLYTSSTAASMNNYGFLLMKTGRLKESERLWQETLDVRRKLYGAEHPEIAMSLVSLGWAKHDLGQLEPAEELMTQGMAMAMKLEGPESMDTAFDQDSLGLVKLERGELADARILLDKALAARLRKASPSPSRLADSYDHLGQLKLVDGEIEGARGDLQHGLDLRLSFYGEENDSTVQSLLHLGQLELATNHPALAEQDFARASVNASALFPNVDHPLTAQALLGLGWAEGESVQGAANIAKGAQMLQKLGLSSPCASAREPNTGFHAQLTSKAEYRASSRMELPCASIPGRLTLAR